MDSRINQEWLGMVDLRRKDYKRSVWIPIRASRYIEKEGNICYVGYLEEFFGAASMAIPVNKVDGSKQIGWADLNISSVHSGCVDDGDYRPSDVCQIDMLECDGLNLVLVQRMDDEGPDVWHLHQDIVITLKLRKEGDLWVCPKDGYAEVARISYCAEKRPQLLEIKAEYLKDYLCARGMALCLNSFHSRHVVVEDASFVNWVDGYKVEDDQCERWEGRITAIHEGNGGRFGEKCAIFNVSRTDVYDDEDIPDLSAEATDENTLGYSYEGAFQGREVYRILCDLWKSDIILPSKHSQRIRGDDEPNPPRFIIDVEGGTVAGREMSNAGKWLWFKPDIVQALLNIRGSKLDFYTRQTGGIVCCHDCCVNFGINDLGLINVFAEDIALLEMWQQKIWAGFNVSPDGRVSSELLDSQVRAKRANTQAAESFFARGLKQFSDKAREQLGISILRGHDDVPEIISRIHRFRALDDITLRELAKDIARVTADDLDAKQMQSVVKPPEGSKWGSLKSLENLLTIGVGKAKAEQLLAPLFGIYNLRVADAHLPTSGIDESYKLVGIDRELPYVHQGEMLIRRAVDTFYLLADAFEQCGTKKR